LETLDKDRLYRIWSLIIYNKGLSKYRKDYPDLVLSGKLTRGIRIGEYTNHNNRITIWWKKHDTLNEIASTLLHEYTHYRQFWPWYIRYSNLYNYTKNPYEIAAKNAESGANYYMHETTDTVWDKIISKNKNIRSIYNKIVSDIVIK
jgi:hypothetical protein